MQTQPIAIVLTAYNASRFIRATVDGVLQQSLSNWVLIAVDDGSVDETSQILEQYAHRDNRIRLIRQDNSGVAQARNAGYASVPEDSEYVIFLDHDDVWENDALATLCHALSSNSSASAAYGLGRYIDADGRIQKPGELESAQKARQGYVNGTIVDWPLESPSTFDVMVFWSYITTPGQVLIRRNALPPPPIFDQSVAPADDWHLWFRLALRGEIQLVPQVVLNYRLHNTNASLNADKMDAASIRARRKFHQLPQLTRKQREAVLACHKMVETNKARVRWAAAKISLRRGHMRDAADEALRAIIAFLRTKTPSP